MTKKILYLQELANDWKLFGKTGNGYLLNADSSKNYDRQIGWFIGWIQKDERVILFVKRIIDSKKEETYASQRAKKMILDSFINNAGSL
jgi:beta-lactamase class D